MSLISVKKIKKISVQKLDKKYSLNKNYDNEFNKFGFKIRIQSSRLLYKLYRLNPKASDTASKSYLFCLKLENFDLPLQNSTLVRNKTSSDE